MSWHRMAVWHSMQWLIAMSDVKKAMVFYRLETINHILKQICVYVYMYCVHVEKDTKLVWCQNTHRCGGIRSRVWEKKEDFLGWSGRMLRKKRFDLGTPEKPVLRYFHAKIPQIKQWTTSNFLISIYSNSGWLIDFVIRDCCFRIGFQSLYRKIDIKS